MLASGLVAVFALIATVSADTPANCTYEDIRGSWIFYIGDGGHDKTVDCTSLSKLIHYFVERAFKLDKC